MKFLSNKARGVLCEVRPEYLYIADTYQSPEYEGLN
jgi:hypothetical protein